MDFVDFNGLNRNELFEDLFEIQIFRIEPVGRACLHSLIHKI